MVKVFEKSKLQVPIGKRKVLLNMTAQSVRVCDVVISRLSDPVSRLNDLLNILSVCDRSYI
jgi:hypothetical protein